MITVRHNDVFVDAEPLETRFPPGVIDEKESPEAGNAARAVRALEKIIEETSAGTATRARYSLLQSFPRLGSKAGTEESNLADYCRALCPQWYQEFLDSLTETEAEVFFKNYLLGHETWGHPEGVRLLVKTMLESIVNDEVSVEVSLVGGEDREIPHVEQSRLGNKNQSSVLGLSMVLGTQFKCRSRYFDVIVGPISYMRLEVFQKAGWAREAGASAKLQRLVEFADPFYLRARVVFLLESKGFVLGHAVLGKNLLGVASVHYRERINSTDLMH